MTALTSRVAQFEQDVDIVHDIVHGPASGAGSMVGTEGGQLKTLAKLLADADQEVIESVGLRTDLVAPGGSARVGYGAGDTVEGALSARLPEIANYAAVRAYDGAADAHYVRGVSHIFDGGAGVFRVDPDDTTSADNGVTVLVDAVGRRRKRPDDGAINVLWSEGIDRSGSADSSDAILAAVALGKSVKWPDGVFRITKQIGGNGGAWIGAGSGGVYDSNQTAGCTILRCEGANGGAAFLRPPTVFEGFHIDGVDKAGVGVQLGLNGIFTGFQLWKNIHIRRFDIGLDAYNYYSVELDGIVIQGNNRGIRAAPTDTAADDGYWTATTWRNVHIADNTVYGLYANAPLGVKTWCWDNVVIERNGADGVCQSDLRNVQIHGEGVYFEGTPTKPAIKSTSLVLALTNSRFGGTGGIDATNNSIQLFLRETNFESATDVFANFPATAKIIAENCTIQTDVRNLGNGVRLFNTTTGGVYVAARDRVLSAGVPNIDGIQPSSIDLTTAYRKTISGTIPANGRLLSITDQYHYAIWNSGVMARASLRDYQPGVICEVRPGTTGSLNHFCVELINTTASPITITAKALNVWFLRSSDYIDLT